MEVVDAVVDQEQPKQVFDIDNNKWIDNPLLNKTEDKEEKEPEQKPEVKAKAPKDAKKEEVKEEPETEDEESEEEETEDEPEEEEETEDEPEDKKKSEDADITTPDAFVEHFYGEKYGVKNEEELVELIEGSLDIHDKYEALNKEHQALRSEAGKPKFTSDKQQKAFEFLSQFDIDRQGEALDTYAKLLSMDMESADPKSIMEEAFVHRNMNKWNRAESQRMFAKEHARKYSLKRESFDGTDEEYNQEIADLKTIEKGDLMDAKSYLKEQKSKYKPVEKEQATTPEVITKAVEKNASEYSEYLSKVKDLSFGDEGDKHVFTPDADQKEQLSDAIDAWVRNPANYNEKGQLKGVKNPQHMIDMLSGSLFIHEIIRSLKSRISNEVNTKRVDELAKQQPKKRKVPVGGSKLQSDDLDSEALRIIRQRKAA